MHERSSSFLSSLSKQSERDGWMEEGCGEMYTFGGWRIQERDQYVLLLLSLSTIVAANSIGHNLNYACSARKLQQTLEGKVMLSSEFMTGNQLAQNKAMSGETFRNSFFPKGIHYVC